MAERRVDEGGGAQIMAKGHGVALELIEAGLKPAQPDAPVIAGGSPRSPGLRRDDDREKGDDRL